MMTFLLVGIFILILGYFLIRKKRAKATENSAPLPDYASILNREVSFYQALDKTSKDKFLNLIDEFLGYVRIEGVGTKISDLDRVLIASSAIIPIFGFSEWKYKNLTNVILYPDTFDNNFQFEGESRNIQGMVGSGYMNGQMLLSRAALLKGFSTVSGKDNTGIHEFVHLLDKSDGSADGIPENLMARQYVVPWLKMMNQEMRRIERGDSDIDPYALTNETEFLSVAAEYFFEKPEKFRHMHPELYNMLSQIFSQDPESSKIH